MGFWWNIIEKNCTFAVFMRKILGVHLLFTRNKLCFNSPPNAAPVSLETIPTILFIRSSKRRLKIVVVGGGGN